MKGGSMIGVNRRRVMDGHDEIIMTSETNPEVLAVCYAQGWAKHADYMTKREAEKVTDIGTAFKGADINKFHEFQFFTLVSTIPFEAFRASTISEITLPSSVSIVKRLAFGECLSLSSIVLNEGVTVVETQWIWGSRTRLIEFPSTISTMSGYGFQPNLYIDYTCICRAISPPTLGYSQYTNRLMAFYVPDDSVDLYRNANKWSDFSAKIKPISEYIE